MTELVGDGPGDFAAWHKLITGSWVYNIVTGDVISMNTGEPLRFRPEKGRLCARTEVHRRRFTVYKDQVARVAVWIGRCEGHIPRRET
jgi:hypothetical protein